MVDNNKVYKKRKNMIGQGSAPVVVAAAAAAQVVLANQAAEALKVVATSAAEAVATVASQAATDRATLGLDITYIKENITEIKLTIKEAANNYSSKTETNDHEKRIRDLETRTLVWVGGLSVLTFLVPLVIKFFVP